MKVLLGMSGGFDSTYSAKLLMDEGHEVAGAVLIMHDHTDLEKPRRAAKLLGIPLFEIDCRTLFDSVVMENFALEYSRGRTPNPCVICNPQVKFKVLFDFAREHGFDRIATGHYSELVEYVDVDGIARPTFKIPKDRSKDQTYMLYRLPGEIIEMLYFPLSAYVKEELRRSVADTELSVIDSKDSQEICFLPDGGYAEFVESRVGETKRGNFVTSDGRAIGPHCGIAHYTVGQRKGLGVSLGERMFVTDIDASSGDITLSPSPLMTSRVELSDCHMTAIAHTSGRSLRLLAKVRYAAPRVQATVNLLRSGRAEVILDEPQRSVTKGQSLVLYDGDILIGGGIIDSVYSN